MDQDSGTRRSGVVLVVGAGGYFARHVAPRLLRRGVRVRGLVHHDRGESVARSKGIEDVARADLRDEAALRRTLAGVEAVFYIPPKFLPDEAELGVRLVGLAAEAGVRRFVLSGVIHPFLSAMRNHRAKAPVAEALVRSGMVYTILQPTNLMQSIEAFVWDKAIATGELVQPWAKERRLGYVDYRDVADVAVEALTGNRLRCGVFDLAASGMVSGDDLAGLMSGALGRPIVALSETPERWVERHLPPVPLLREAFAEMGGFYDRHGLPGDNDLVLRAILGRAPRTLAAFVAELAGRAPGGTAAAGEANRRETAAA